jgi:integrase/recombinase XerD
MSRKSDRVPQWAPAHQELYDVYKDFLLSRKAILCRDQTLVWYAEALLRILEWMIQNGVTHPADITARQVRAYLASMKDRNLKDSYIHNHARTIRTFLRFLYQEKYIPELPTFKMPAIAQRQLLYLTAPDVQKLLKACECKRDKTLILLMVDTGARRSEVCALNWEDVDIDSGLVHIVEGKGGKTRSVVVGIETRRAVLAYRRELNPQPRNPLFQTQDGKRFQVMGFRSVFDRLAKRSGVKVTPHALRRTFATLSLKAGMNPLHLQALMGHTTLEMTRRYITMVDDDLVVAHKEYGPIDNILHKARK